MDELVETERELMRWWDPSTFRGRAVQNREDVAAGALSMVGDVLGMLETALHARDAKWTDRLAAASLILDRAIGKATQEVRVTASYVPPQLEGAGLLDMLAAAQVELQRRTIDVTPQEGACGDSSPADAP